MTTQETRRTRQFLPLGLAVLIVVLSLLLATFAVNSTRTENSCGGLGPCGSSTNSRAVERLAIIGSGLVASGGLLVLARRSPRQR